MRYRTLALALFLAGCASGAGLTCGTVANGNFANSNTAFDSYFLQMLPGDVISVRLVSTGTPFTPAFVVQSEDSTIIPAQRATFSVGATIAANYAFPGGGFFVLNVENRSQAQGAAYLLTYTLLNRACSEVSLTCGATRQDQITSAMQVPSYQFAVNAGDVISARALRTAPFTTSGNVAFSPMAVAYASDGTLVNGALYQVSGTPGLQYNFTAPSTGLLTVLVFDSNNLTGNFVVSATKLNGGCGGTTLNCGQVTQGSIAGPASLSVSTIPMLAGDTGTIRTVATGTAATLAPFIELYDEQGNQVTGGTGALPFSARNAGAYTLLVRDGSPDGTGTGAFASLLTRFNRPCNAQSALSCSSAADGTVSGLMNNTTYTLSAAANDVYLVRLLNTSQNPTFVPRADVYDPQGNLVTSLVTSGLDRQTLTLTGGNYALIVSDGYDGSQSGTYTLSTLRLNAPCKAGNLSCGGVAAGSFSRPLGVGVYNYSAAAGESFSVRMFDASGALQPGLEVYDPSGKRVGQSISAAYTGADVVQPAAGAYAILALDNSAHPAGGPFALNLQRTVNACSAAAPQGQTVAGAITSAQPFVSYTIPAAASDALLVRSASSTPGFAAQMELYDPTGARMDSQTYALTRQASAAGNYTVIVGAAAARAGGGYALSWQALNKPQGAVPLACGGTANGLLSGTGQFQFYSVAAGAGDVLRLLLTPLSDSFAPEVAVYDPNGARVAKSLDVRQAATLAGNYLIMVSPSSSAAASGTYALAFQRPNNPCNAATLICGQTALRPVMVPAQLDAYTFTGTGGDRADIKLVQRSGGYTPFAELYDPAGALVTASSSGTILATPPRTGPYTLLVRDTRGTTTGSYRVSLQDDTNACTVTDTQPPTVALMAPTGGEAIGGGTAFVIQWQSDDNVGVAKHDIALSTDGGQTFPTAIAAGLSGNTQSYMWAVPANIAPSRTAVIRVTATDAAGNASAASSAALTLIGSGFSPNNTATYTYDSMNRISQAVLSDGRTVTYTYDAAGNLVGVTITRK